MRKRMLASAVGAGMLFLVSLAAYAYPSNAGKEVRKPRTAESLQTRQPAVTAYAEIHATPKATRKPGMFSEKEVCLLMKIAMAEAEDEDTEGKALVMRVVLNRVRSRKFPDSIGEVVYQDAQFSPVANGRFDRVEPDRDCRRALEMIQKDGWDGSKGALYFESKSKSTWHEDNLQYLFRHGGHYFYTDREEEE